MNKCILTSIGIILTSTTMVSNADVPKSTWISLMKKNLPPFMCRIFNQKSGFAINQKKCTKRIQPILNTCIAKYSSEIPSTLDRNSGKLWGRKIGDCTGANYFNAISLPKKKWLSLLKNHYTQHQCKTENLPTFSKNLNISLSSNQCLTIVTNGFTQCAGKFSAQIPDQIDFANRKQWQITIEKCAFNNVMAALRKQS